MEWLARFDFRWSTPAPVFAFWQRKLGLSTGWGGGGAWTAKIGEERVRQLLVEGRLMSAYESLRLGLVDRIVSAADINRLCNEWAESVKDGGGLTSWSANKESLWFSKLWLGATHSAVLKKWK
jgi:enoyl-CoA hydratase/carnithine racemase